MAPPNIRGINSPVLVLINFQSQKSDYKQASHKTRHPHAKCRVGFGGTRHIGLFSQLQSLNKEKIKKYFICEKLQLFRYLGCRSGIMDTENYISWMYKGCRVTRYGDLWFVAFSDNFFGDMDIGFSSRQGVIDYIDLLSVRCRYCLRVSNNKDGMVDRGYHDRCLDLAGKRRSKNKGDKPLVWGHEEDEFNKIVEAIKKRGDLYDGGFSVEG